MKKIGCLLLLLGSVAAQATTLELTQGHDSQIPVAVIQFSGAPSVSKVIANDLNRVGQFTVQYEANSHQGDAPSAMIAGQWRNSGVNDVIVGRAKKLGPNKYDITYSLIDVFSQAGHNGGNPVLSSQQYEVKTSQLRQAAHAISDDVYYQLTGKPGAFSSKIAYVVAKGKAKQREYRLVVSDYDGANAQTVVKSPLPLLSPRWSPDGKEIAYVSFGNDGSEVYILNVTSGQRTLLLHFPGLNSAPAWSPDGKKLAVTLSEGGAQDIYLLTIADKSLQQLTHGSAIDTEPRFAPNGKTLLFVSNRQGSPEIYQYTFADASITRLTYNGNFNASPEFMPDGKQIVMIHKADKGYTVAKQNLSDSVLTNLTEPGLVQSPSVAPNGSMIIYTNQSGSGRLAIVASNGKANWVLPGVSGNMQEPAWGKVIG